ncbi:MAG: hypothetical protein IPH89_07200 [Bacteroidetes bacterium]|nr:hypothetical protein [Bacteroidota bacterium]
MKKLLLLLAAIIPFAGIAQTPSFTIGIQRIATATGNSETSTFRIENNNYVLYKKFSMSEGMKLHLEGFSGPNDDFLCSQDIPTPHEVNEVAIYEGFVALSNKMYLFRSVFKKDEKKSALYAHEINEKGIISTTGKEITSIAAEKAMNSGDFSIESSFDGKSFVVLSEYPFVKETKEKFAVTVFDNTLNQLWTKEIELVHDARRGPTNDAFVSNSGVVYVVKKVEGPKNADFYTTYQIADKGAKVKENLIEMEAPKKIVNFSTIIDESNNDLIIAGYYTEDGKVVLGGTGFKGTFVTRISGTTNDVKAKSTTAFDKTRSNLNPVSLQMIKGNIFLVGEDKAENNLATEQKDSKGFPIYNREFVTNDICVSIFDGKGTLITNTILEKENRSIEDGGIANSAAVSIVGDQLMLVYNGYQYKYDGQEHKIVGPALAGIKIPVIQFFGADGSKGRTLPMIDSNVGGKKGIVYLFPNASVQVSDKETFFLSRGDYGYIRPVRLKLP